jgi:uncharacterized protein
VPFDVQVAPSPLGGRGVFATRDFETEEVIEVCPFLEIPVEEISGVMDSYVFSSGKGEHLNVLLFGYGSLYNHSFDPNVEVREHADDAIAMIALRDIAAGEELVHNYGDDYWDTRDIDPG